MWDLIQIISSTLQLESMSIVLLQSVRPRVPLLQWQQTLDFRLPKTVAALSWASSCGTECGLCLARERECKCWARGAICWFRALASALRRFDFAPCRLCSQCVAAQIQRRPNRRRPTCRQLTLERRAKLVRVRHEQLAQRLLFRPIEQTAVSSECNQTARRFRLSAKRRSAVEQDRVLLDYTMFLFLKINCINSNITFFVCLRWYWVLLLLGLTLWVHWCELFQLAQLLLREASLDCEHLQVHLDGYG